MAKVVVTNLQDWRKIAELAGGDPLIIMHDPATNELECPDVAQPALDQALIDYVADQVNIDAATAASKETTSRDGDKSWYDNKRLFRALVEVLLDEINALRTIEGLPDRTIAQARTAIQGKIDTL
jgi:hypothetical protein